MGNYNKVRFKSSNQYILNLVKDTNYVEGRTSEEEIASIFNYLKN
ncbi:hypothetical protein [Clostridium estertheticum]|nr:hypothetical protein [Clostridium estertheticum]